jgi:glycosyltransferase involved in cell wall biosynthesis
LVIVSGQAVAMSLALIIPAYNEEGSIHRVVTGFQSAMSLLGTPGHIWVVDNGSTDDTVREASRAGARVLTATQRGYGAACLVGVAAALHADVDVVGFADGDGADDPADLPRLWGALANADLVIGTRTAGRGLGLAEPSSLTRSQRIGNALASRLLRLGYGVPATDLGPFRLVTAAALRRLRMDDEGFGWTVQMQARAARIGLVTREVMVHHRRRREGASKISGDLRASVRAGQVILTTLAAEWRFRE